MGVTRALTSAGLVGVVLLSAACQSGSGTKEGADPNTPSASAPTSPSDDPTTAPTSSTSADPAVLDPDLAVPEPGPRTGRLFPADLLVNSTQPLTDAEISAVKALKGVISVETMGLAQVQVEDRVLNIAAVDPASYRRFTPLASADFQEVWDRVADGEVAVLPSLKKKLPMDQQGFVKLGSNADAPEAHVGAFAPQIPKAVDAVVNTQWVKPLGMQPDNALLISTGITSPQSVQKQIQAIVGKQSPVQILGPDLKIGATLSAVLVGTVAQAVGVFNYRVLGGGMVAPEASWVASHIRTEVVPIIGSVTCNKAIFPQLKAALGEVVARGLSSKIHPGEYAGCYYPRFIAGSNTLSNHAFGLALDLNTPGNQRGTVGEMDRTVVSIFKRWGFTWGGDWRYTDPMHFEMNAIVDPQ